MTKASYLGSVLIAFALGGLGMWAVQGNYKPLWNHLLAQFDSHHLVSTSNQAAASTNPATNVTSQSQQQLGQNVPGLGTTSSQAPANPFREMAQMQQQMNRFFSRNGFFGFGGGHVNGQSGTSGQGFFNFGPGGFFGNTNSFFSNQTGNMGATITQGENAHSVYYKMRLGHHQDVSNVKVNVKHGYVSIDAQLQNKSRNAFSSSTVSERFPVPAGVNPNSAKITKKGDSIVIRFSKV